MSDPLDHHQKLAGRGDRDGGVGRAAVGDRQGCKCEATLEADEIGPVLEIGQQVGQVDRRAAVALAYDEGIGSGTAGQRVGAQTAAQRIVAAIGEESVVAPGAVQRFADVSSDQDILARVTGQPRP